MKREIHLERLLGLGTPRGYVIRWDEMDIESLTTRIAKKHLRSFEGQPPEAS